MTESVFFSMIVEPSLERLPVLTVQHDVTFDLRDFVVSHAISKHVLTEFDARLSDHMAAVSGEGMPAYTLDTRVFEPHSSRSWRPYGARHFTSMPHALKQAAELSLGTEDTVPVQIVHGAAQGTVDEGIETEITRTTLSSLNAALDICAEIGDIAFLDMTGDLDRITVRPRGSTLDPVVMNLRSGTVTVPTAGGPASTAYQGALLGFADAVRRDIHASTYVAQARHAVSREKESAILGFRAAAEKRIHDFNEALNDQPLIGYRLEAATTLVARLQAGLGSGLRGLNEEAQITALGWAAQIKKVPDIHAVTARHVGDVLEHVPSGPRLVT